MKKTIILLLTLLSLQSNVHSEESYMFGGAKLFNYGIEKSDLQAINTSLVALGFSSSASSTDNSGIGFDIGFGVEMAPNFSFEGSYVNYGTLEIKTNTTGPTENITTEITGDGFVGAVKYSQEGYYVKGGIHSWDFSGKVTASLGSSSESLGTGTDPFFGVGFGSDQMELGYEYYSIEDGSISALTLRYAHKF
ncbi:hypothetical protein N9L88_02365 [Candidatus Pelagibacter bacterium]|jgi:hypothetical protein|nr:hypothetical protein [Candidatus Pelagibacter bacterium]